MSELQFVCLIIGISVWPVAEMVHEAYEWVLDEYYAWRLKRAYKKLYWFLNK